MSQAWIRSRNLACVRPVSRSEVEWAQVFVVALLGAALGGAVWRWLERRKPGNRLIEAAEKNRLEEMRRLLDQGVDPNFRGSFGLTPLAAAVAKKRVEAARLLLERGASPEGALLKMSYVAFLAGEKRPDLLRLLLEHGADPEGRGPLGESALNIAVGEGDVESVRALLEHGADPNRPGRHGSPLITAVTSGDAALVRVLLEAGADPNAEIPQIGTPLLLAVAFAHREVLEAHRETEKRLAVVRALLEGGADPNRSSLGGVIPFHEAVVRGLVETVRLMLEFGGDPTRRTGDVDAWDLAEANGDRAMLEVLGPRRAGLW